MNPFRIVARKFREAHKELAAERKARGRYYRPSLRARAMGQKGYYMTDEQRAAADEAWQEGRRKGWF